MARREGAGGKEERRRTPGGRRRPGRRGAAAEPLAALGRAALQILPELLPRAARIHRSALKLELQLHSKPSNLFPQIRSGTATRGRSSRRSTTTAEREESESSLPGATTRRPECRNQQVRRRRVLGAQGPGTGTGGSSECLRALAEVAAAARLQVPLRGLRRALGKRLRFILVASGGREQPVLGGICGALGSCSPWAWWPVCRRSRGQS